MLYIYLTFHQTVKVIVKGILQLEDKHIHTVQFVYLFSFLRITTAILWFKFALSVSYFLSLKLHMYKRQIQQLTESLSAVIHVYLRAWRPVLICNGKCKSFVLKPFIMPPS